MRTLGYAFCQPPKKSYHNLSPQKSYHKISNLKKVLRLQISNPKKVFGHPITIPLGGNPGVKKVRSLREAGKETAGKWDTQGGNIGKHFATV